ncbi:MAG: hypothetical protein ACFFCD_01585 [Promethearchaeota archaeon]
MSKRIEELLFPSRFDWGIYPQVEKFLNDQIAIFLEHNSVASKLSARMLKETSTFFFDWVDHIILPEKKVTQNDLETLGFQAVYGIDALQGNQVYIFPGATYFPVILSNNSATEIALKPERLDHFIQMTGEHLKIEGTTLSSYRKAIVSSQGDYVLSVVERRGYNGFIVPEEDKDAEEYNKAMEAFCCRQRLFEVDREGIKATLELIKRFLKNLKKERVTDAFFRSERLYWERQNRAGYIQKGRQNRLGLGYGNHDHHTYRNSRENFSQVIEILETLGFVSREQFFAGERAGWGAQVLEHPVCSFTVFADVDISKEEKEQDFAHQKMTDRDELKTVGLWVALHGESMLGAGLHHLATRLAFEKVNSDLEISRVEMLRPFSYFPFLKQAFSEVERREVRKKRLDRLLNKKQITMEQYKKFLEGGAISSHLENIQRNQGFKGFNQDSVSAIITATDPRATTAGVVAA